MRAARLWPLQLEPSCSASPSSKAWRKSKAATTSPLPAQRSGSSRTLGPPDTSSPLAVALRPGAQFALDPGIFLLCLRAPLPASALGARSRAVRTDDPCETAGLAACGLLRRRLVPILAQVPDDAAGTGRLACGADVAPMQEQPVGGGLAGPGRRVG